jgi:hypothetical protein
MWILYASGLISRPLEVCPAHDEAFPVDIQSLLVEDMKIARSVPTSSGVSYEETCRKERNPLRSMDDCALVIVVTLLP